jgi:lysozyme family protein
MITSPVFTRSVIFVLKHEGGYVNDPGDPGGETKYGISKRSYPDLDIPNLTIDTARRIYRQDYWDELRCGDMPPALAMAVFDSAINCGRHRTAMWLQEAIKNFGFEIATDGLIGDRTINAIKKCDAQRLCLFLLYSRCFHYACLGKKYPRFVCGWTARTAELMREIAWL